MIQILPPLPHALSLSLCSSPFLSRERVLFVSREKKKEESLLAAIPFVLSLTAISSTKTPCLGHYSSSLNFNRQCTTAIFSISSFSFFPRSIQALHYTIPSRIRSFLMALFPNCLVLVVLIVSRGVLVSGATFTFINKCDFTVWPGILVSAGSPKLDSTGFELSKGSSRTFQAPTGWSGRFWGRTGCEFDGAGHGSCATGDCGSGQMECNGAGATPPATLAEFTLGSGSQDFYDVSLVDGYNLPMFVEGSGGSGACASTGCVVDLNRRCPTELRADGGGACKSACGAFGTDEYCCSGAYNTPAACKPSMYSQLFKSACPQSYSYAFDDATSTFTCTGADYTITFCPSLPSLKSSRDSSPVVTATIGGSVSDSGTDSGTIPQASFANSWLANLATGDSIRTRPLAFETAIVLVASLILTFLQL